MPVIHIDAIDGKDFAYFFDYVGAACFYTVAVLQLIGVVGLDTREVKGIRIALKRLEIDTLNEKVRLISRFVRPNQPAAFNARNVANKHTVKYVLDDSEQKQFLVLNREADSDSGGRVFDKLWLPYQVLFILGKGAGGLFISWLLCSISSSLLLTSILLIRFTSSLLRGRLTKVALLIGPIVIGGLSL